MKKVVLYMHAGSKNHGCEAIAYSVCRMLQKNKDTEDITLLTYRKEEDVKYTLNNMCNIMQERSFAEHKIAHLFCYARRLLFKDKDIMMRYRYKEALKLKPELAISIGGDNYCYDSMLNDLRLANSVFSKNGAKTILLGCSIEPELLKRDDIKEDLAKYHTIIARESITYEALRNSFGVEEKKSEDFATGVKNIPQVLYIPDPAFTLPYEDVVLPKGFVSGNTVGINISPIVQESESEGGITIEAYRKLIHYIIDNTDMNVALIPHVVWNGNDDRTPIDILYNDAILSGYADRIVRIDDANALKLKGYIRNLRFFVGARTHATIAAYSSMVPTLVVGYSVKARGIAQDLFPQYNVDDLVLQVQNIKESDDLINSFKWLVEHENELKTHLNAVIPGYISKAEQLADVLKEV